MTLIISGGGGSSTPAKWGQHWGYNLTNGISRYKSALANVGTQLVKITCVGDSVTMGEYSSNGTKNGTSASDTTSWVAVLRKAMQNRYGGNAGSGYRNDWTAFNGPSSWSWATAKGYAWQYPDSGSGTTTATNCTISFTGTAIDLLYCQDVGGGAANVTIDGVTPANGPSSISFSAASFNAGQVASYTGLAAGSHTLTITSTGTGPIKPQGVVERTANTGMEINKAAYSGSKASDWNTANVTSAWGAHLPHLATLAFGFNEAATATGANIASTISSYKSNMGSLISYWQGQGVDVLLVAYHRPTDDWASAGYSLWPDFVKAMYDLADQYNCGLIDLYQATLMYPDLLLNLNFIANADDSTGRAGSAAKVHPSDFGYKMLARLIEPVLI